MSDEKLWGAICLNCKQRFILGDERALEKAKESYECLECGNESNFEFMRTEHTYHQELS